MVVVVDSMVPRHKVRHQDRRRRVGTAGVDGQRPPRQDVHHVQRPRLFHGERNKRQRRVAALEDMGRRRPARPCADHRDGRRGVRHVYKPAAPAATSARPQDTHLRNAHHRRAGAVRQGQPRERRGRTDRPRQVWRGNIRASP